MTMIDRYDEFKKMAKRLAGARSGDRNAAAEHFPSKVDGAAAAVMREFASRALTAVTSVRELRNSLAMTPEEAAAFERATDDALLSAAALVDEIKEETVRYARGRLSEQAARHCSSVVADLYSRLDQVNERWAKAKRERLRAMASAARNGGGGGAARSYHGVLPSNDVASVVLERLEQQEPEREAAAHGERAASLRAENEQLLGELHTELEAARQIERQLVQIAQLQAAFSQRVYEQAADIERMYGAIVTASDHVSRANEHLREAGRQSVDFRIFVLVFLIVMGCALLFLNWFTLRGGRR